jgi:hypothetical protein
VADPTGRRGFIRKCPGLRARSLAAPELRGHGFREMHFRWTLGRPGMPTGSRHSATYDPASGGLRLRVGDFDAAVKALEAEGNGCFGLAETR